MNIVRSAVVGLALLMVTGVAVRAEDVEATGILILKGKDEGACLKGGKGRLIGDKHHLALFVREYEGLMTCVQDTDYRSNFEASGQRRKLPVTYKGTKFDGTLEFTVRKQAAETAK